MERFIILSLNQTGFRYKFSFYPTMSLSHPTMSLVDASRLVFDRHMLPIEIQLVRVCHQYLFKTESSLSTIKSIKHLVESYCRLFGCTTPTRLEFHRIKNQISKYVKENAVDDRIHYKMPPQPIELPLIVRIRQVLFMYLRTTPEWHFSFDAICSEYPHAKDIVGDPVWWAHALKDTMPSSYRLNRCYRGNTPKKLSRRLF